MVHVFAVGSAVVVMRNIDGKHGKTESSRSTLRPMNLDEARLVVALLGVCVAGISFAVGYLILISTGNFIHRQKTPDHPFALNKTGFVLYITFECITVVLLSLYALPAVPLYANKKRL